MSQELDDLVEKLSKLTVLDMAKLKKRLEEKWGVTAAVAMAPAAAGAVAEGAAATAESTDFRVTLEGPVADDKKISIIKAVREVTGLGLKEAKDLVEGAPKDLKVSAPKAEAEEIKKKVGAAGGKVKLTGL
ncbi:MAG: 50S ribosomal protein L7/L12 [Chlamydiae bacterium RIFCSPHIGHO2_12_FULL_44_59]|nr:MAG: 50S ribosomal protein L7/L12 [Chlamydiae bacterium RIFCSPHIGHO2_01_FULL_44_39]OGN60733.1 MAG: 50S ribosomal protein L7/L12 [Chlamydiae bacterium RIFCSPHIGHO2_12_FULL_44_59]OGN66994.1 MAG: 50S ribosomal protein L7/L12 [Chlamydiae bacterium RIFCSPLOWO2_01_FULL_44_52]OGN67546.1 MAG: 50S ribosomal protein L7/L12 [Chlamydiae bacterium RIFCSPLOWO2_02_FULL_45_22]OGN71247.1 MAG: 50S ribosomal protein L7/L12 [Chlamydiae bacterium RIFCSPLOWO2_12_FULL_45_20]